MFWNSLDLQRKSVNRDIAMESPRLHNLQQKLFRLLNLQVNNIYSSPSPATQYLIKNKNKEYFTISLF